MNGQTVVLLMKKFGKIEIRIIEDTGHAPFYEKPAEFNEALLGFVGKVQSKVSLYHL